MKHLAIFTDEAIKNIFSGKKVIDSRFSQRKIAPFHMIESGDLVYIKKSGGKVVGQFMVKRVISFDNLSSDLIDKIKKDYNRFIKSDKYFWGDRTEAKYGTLIFIEQVQPVLIPIVIEKRDRRPWVVLKEQTIEN